MDDCTRRHLLLHGAATFGLLSVIGPAEPASAAMTLDTEEKAPVEKDAPAKDPAKAGIPNAERARVMSLGMTGGEADCWLLSAQAAGAFFALPELHPMDRQEVATAIHILQNKLLSRPTYRQYLEKAKEGK